MSLNKSAPVSVFMRLAALADEMKGTVDIAGTGASWTWISRALKNIHGPEKSVMLLNLMTEGECALLLDGLDEVTDENLRNRIVDVVNSALTRWGTSMFVLSSRPFGYHDIADLEEICTARIDAFGENEIIEFLDRWIRGLYRESDAKNGRDYSVELKTAIVNSPPIRKLARNPVMLTCLCVVHWNERKLPEGKADLLAAVLRWLLNAREDIRKQRGYTNTFAEECFKALSFAMTCKDEGKQTIVDLSWAADQLAIPFRDILDIEDRDRVHREGIKFLEEEMLDSGIIEKSGTNRLRFWHLSFQEHYAARALVDRSDEEWWKIIKPELCNRQWYEVLDHMAGCLAWTGFFRPNLLVKKILGAAVHTDLTSIARAVGVLGRILRILVVYDDYRPPARLGWEKARERVMEIFELDGASRVPVDDRIAAAEALGQGGDPRINPANPEMLPVPGIPDVCLGKYPVTVQEYMRFVEDKGYENSEYWGEWWGVKEEQGLSKPGSWDEQIEHLNRPVVEVSWYEAVAYCNWLAIQTGLPYRLPASMEWEEAAASTEGDYPWGGDEPGTELLNYDGNVGNPTPVGVYPKGAAPGGHLDMAGNIWEWNRDLYDKGGSNRGLRGGSWFNYAHNCRSASRYLSSDNRDHDLGFRLSRSVSPGS